MPREVMSCPSAADALLMMCQGPDKTELSEEPSYRVTATAKEIQEKFRAKIEDMIVEAVRNVGIEVVDKEGLMAALTEDKQRYDEAYKKGYRACEKLLDKAIKALTEHELVPCVEIRKADNGWCINHCERECPDEECWRKFLEEETSDE